MAISSRFKKSQVNFTKLPNLLEHFANVSTVVKKDWTLSEWLNAFLEAELAGWDEYEPDDYDEGTHTAGDDYYGDGYHGDDIDSDILESLIILALSGALAFLLYYRTQRQRRQEEERRRQQEQQQQLNQGIVAGQQQPQQAQGQQGRGLFPQPGDPEFMNWVAGGVGH
jgi:SEL1 protein